MTLRTAKIVLMAALAWPPSVAAGQVPLQGVRQDVVGQVPLEVVDAKSIEESPAPSTSPMVGIGKFAEGGANCVDGMAGGYPCLGVSLRRVLTTEELGAPPGIRINDLWGWHDEERGRYYILVGREDGAAFVDVTDSNNPVYIGELPRTTGSISSSWRDIKVIDHYALIVADGARSHGVQIFDLFDLRNVTSPQVFSERAHYAGVASSHNIVVDEESHVAYAVGSRSGGITCNGGLHMIDFADPLNPAFAGCVLDARSRNGYTHDAQCLVYRGPDTEHTGKQVCFGANVTALSIVDVTDKSTPVFLGSGEYPTSRYIHQGWLSEDQGYFFLDDEGDEGLVAGTRTLVWDVRDLDDPVLLKEYISPLHTVDHNQYVVGNFLYQANYTSGLRILDISNPSDPQLVKYFDTHPSDDALGYEGAWSVFPFFDNGMVYVSSRGEGLFILDPGENPITEIASTGITVQGTSVQVTWSTTTEFHVSGFEIQERSGESSFVTRAFIPGAGTSSHPRSYSYEFDGESEGRHEYRIQIVSEDNSRNAEPAKEIFVVPGTHVRSDVYPNPVADHARVDVIVKKSQHVRATLFDIQGRAVAVYFDEIIFNGTQREMVIDVTDLAGGHYFLRIVGELFEETLPLVVSR